MPNDTREPQSYGSGGDWQSGKTGQQPNDPKATPPPEHQQFYDESRESETTDHHQGGRVSDLQMAEHAQTPQGSPTGEDSPIPRVTTSEGGSKRDSYFRKRDYE